MPDGITAEAKSLLEALLEKQKQERIGCGLGGAQEVMSHSFLHDIDWVALRAGSLKAPLVPATTVNLDSIGEVGEVAQPKLKLEKAHFGKFERWQWADERSMQREVVESVIKAAAGDEQIGSKWCCCG